MDAIALLYPSHIVIYIIQYSRYGCLRGIQVTYMYLVALRCCGYM